MRTVKFIGTALVALCFVAPASAQQGLFTEKGFGAEIGFQSGSDVSNVGASLGYVVNRMFEAGLGIDRESYSELDGNITYFTPRFRVYPVRQGESVPVTIYGEAHYHFASLSGPYYEDTSASGWGIGLGAAHALMAGENLRVQPFASLAYLSWTEEYMDLEADPDNPLRFVLGVYFAAGVGPGNLYAAPVFDLTTGTGDEDSVAQFGIRIGLVLDQN